VKGRKEGKTRKEDRYVKTGRKEGSEGSEVKEGREGRK
jgi:hypothetical protein